MSTLPASRFNTHPQNLSMMQRNIFSYLLAFPLAAVLLTAAPADEQKSADDKKSADAAQSHKEEGFVKLFDGKSLEGWKANENPESFKLEDGTIVAHGERSHLFFVGDEKPFDNFHLKVEVKTTPGSNSGIYFHTRFQESGWPTYGYECQVNISQSDPKKSSGLYGVQDVFDPPAKDDQWYTQEIIVQGRHIVTKVNGKTVVDYTEPDSNEAAESDSQRRLDKGTFALQAHDPDSKVYFKNIRVKRLD